MDIICHFSIISFFSFFVQNPITSVSKKTLDQPKHLSCQEERKTKETTFTKNISMEEILVNFRLRNLD